VLLLSFSKDIFLRFLLPIYLVFSHKLELLFLHLSYKIFICDSGFVCDQGVDHQVFYFCNPKGWRLRPRRACGFACALFLQEQVRDLLVQELLRKLIGVAVSSDLAGSILVEIFHCGEGGNVEQVARTSKQSLVFAIAHLTLLYSLVFISSMLLLLVYL